MGFVMELVDLLVVPAGKSVQGMRVVGAGYNDGERVGVIRRALGLQQIVVAGVAVGTDVEMPDAAVVAGQIIVHFVVVVSVVLVKSAVAAAVVVGQRIGHFVVELLQIVVLVKPVVPQQYSVVAAAVVVVKSVVVAAAVVKSVVVVAAVAKSVVVAVRSVVVAEPENVHVVVKIEAEFPAIVEFAECIVSEELKEVAAAVVAKVFERELDDVVVAVKELVVQAVLVEQRHVVAVVAMLGEWLLDVRKAAAVAAETGVVMPVGQCERVIAAVAVLVVVAKYFELQHFGYTEQVELGRVVAVAAVARTAAWGKLAQFSLNPSLLETCLGWQDPQL